jgi:UDP-N-acetylglucosamine transferase subunit ALG13
VIFVTLGTHHDPFPRLIEGLRTLDGDELVVQHGHSPAPLDAARATRFMPFEEMLEQIRAADAVVTHAGVGTILTCLRLGRTPLVVPRQRRLGEHVDDHQVELTRALADERKVVPVWDMADLPKLVEVAPPARAFDDGANDGFHQAVRDALRPAPRRFRRRPKNAVPIAS